MSADNFFVVRRHPKGGFALVMGFASDVDEAGEERAPEVDHGHHRYATIDEAVADGLAEYSEYGVSVHPECRQPLPGVTSGHDPLCPAGGWEVEEGLVEPGDCHCPLISLATRRVIGQAKHAITQAQDEAESGESIIVTVGLGSRDPAVYINRDAALNAIDALLPPVTFIFVVDGVETDDEGWTKALPSALRCADWERRDGVVLARYVCHPGDDIWGDNALAFARLIEQMLPEARVRSWVEVPAKERGQ